MRSCVRTLRSVWPCHSSVARRSRPPGIEPKKRALSGTGEVVGAAAAGQVVEGGPARGWEEQPRERAVWSEPLAPSAADLARPAAVLRAGKEVADLSDEVVVELVPWNPHQGRWRHGGSTGKGGEGPSGVTFASAVMVANVRVWRARVSGGRKGKGQSG